MTVVPENAGLVDKNRGKGLCGQTSLFTLIMCCKQKYSKGKGNISAQATVSQGSLAARTANFHLILDPTCWGRLPMLSSGAFRHGRWSVPLAAGYMLAHRVSGWEQESWGALCLSLSQSPGSCLLALVWQVPCSMPRPRQQHPWDTNEGISGGYVALSQSHLISGNEPFPEGCLNHRNPGSCKWCSSWSVERRGSNWNYKMKTRY